MNGPLRKFKTKTEVTMSKMYRGFDDWAVGDCVIGKIVGTNKDKYGHTGPVVKVIEAQFKKDAEKFVGKNLAINSTGKMRKNMPEFTMGELIQVEYLGKNTMEKGKFAGKDAHDVNILILEEDDGSDVEVDDDEEVDL